MGWKNHGKLNIVSEKVPQKVHLVSLGCPKNTVDSERMLGLLQGNAYQMTEAADEADVVVVNTCGFIGPAKEESIEAIMDAHRLKEEGKCKGVVVTGCLSRNNVALLGLDVPPLQDEPGARSRQQKSW